jgi:hypothetical protein
MPLLEIYKDNEISASAVQSDAGGWTPQVTVTEIRLKMDVTVPNITQAFRQEKKQKNKVCHSRRTGLTRGSQRLDHRPDRFLG